MNEQQTLAMQQAWDSKHGLNLSVNSAGNKALFESGYRAALEDMQKEDSPLLRKSTFDLTARQMEVLQCLLDGKSNKEISRHLEMGLGTVKSHLAAIYRALNCKTRLQLVSLVRAAQGAV